MEKISKSIYIYGLYCPFTLELKYIGKTACKNLKIRLWGHMAENKWYRTVKHDNPKQLWIEELYNQNTRPEIKLISVHPLQESNYWEKYWVYFYNREGKLLNLKHNIHIKRLHKNPPNVYRSKT